MEEDNRYRFEICLLNVDVNTPDLEDILYLAGCGDAFLHFSGGRTFLEFNRVAASLEAAEEEAIADIRKASIPIFVMKTRYID